MSDVTVCGARGIIARVIRFHLPPFTRVAISRSHARTHVITAHRARHHRPPSPMSPMRARGSGGGAVSFARLLARAEAEADGHSHVVRVSRVTRARARIILVTALVSATPIEVRSVRRRLFSLRSRLLFLRLSARALRRNDRRHVSK